MRRRTPRKILRRSAFNSIGREASPFFRSACFEFAKQYPRADAGAGCVTNDIPLREKQEKYTRFYNEKMYDFVSKNPEIGKLKN